VTYKETVSATSSQVCLAKSQNRHNRLYATAEPLGETFTMAIENKDIDPQAETKDLAKYLNELFDWDLSDAKKIWSFGPEDNGPNLLVD